MPRLLVLCLLRRRRRVAYSSRRMAHSESGRNLRSASSVDVAVGLVVIFMTFLTPCGYMLRNLRLRRD